MFFFAIFLINYRYACCSTASEENKWYEIPKGYTKVTLNVICWQNDCGVAKIYEAYVEIYDTDKKTILGKNNQDSIPAGDAYSGGTNACMDKSTRYSISVITAHLDPL